VSNVALHITWSQPTAEVTDTIIGYVLQIRKMGGEFVFNSCFEQKDFK
jgi:nucleoside permease NupC